MKVKVLKKFRDKETKKVYQKGKTYEGTEERIKEIAEKGYIEKPKKQSIKKTTKKEDA